MVYVSIIVAVVALAAPTFTRALPAKSLDLASLTPQHHSEPETLLGKPYVVRDPKAVLPGYERSERGGIFPNGLLWRFARFQITQSKRTGEVERGERDVDVFSNQPSLQSPTLPTPSTLPPSSPAHVE